MLELGSKAANFGLLARFALDDGLKKGSTVRAALRSFHLLHVAVGVGYKLHDLVTHVGTLASKIVDHRVVTGNPRVVKSVLDGDALFAALREQFQNQVFAILGDG